MKGAVIWLACLLLLSSSAWAQASPPSPSPPPAQAANDLQAQADAARLALQKSQIGPSLIEVFLTTGQGILELFKVSPLLFVLFFLTVLFVNWLVLEGIFHVGRYVPGWGIVILSFAITTFFFTILMQFAGPQILGLLQALQNMVFSPSAPAAPGVPPPLLPTPPSPPPTPGASPTPPTLHIWGGS